MNEHLTKASDAAALLVADLREAIAHCSAVESIIVSDLIADAAQLNQRIKYLVEMIR